MTGAGGKVQFHAVIAGAPDTISTTPTWACTKIISTNPDGLISKKQVTIAFEIDDFSDATLTALKALVSDVEPSETTAEKYETGVESSEGGAAASGTVVRSVMIKYGGILSSTKIHVIVAHGYVTNASWAHTTKFEDVTKPALEYKTAKLATAGNIALAAGVWDNTIVKTTTPSPALPTSITTGTYGDDYGLERAA